MKTKMKLTTLYCVLGALLLIPFQAEARFSDDRNYSASRGSYKPFSGYIAATGNKTIIVDPNSHSWAAYDEAGQMVRSGRASLGKDYCPDIKRGCRTVTGTFTIFSKKGAGCKSSRFPLPNGGAPMAYCMHFHKGYAIHGSNAVPPANASHGCVRVPVPDARWLNTQFAEYGTRVIVRPYAKAPAKKKPRLVYEEEMQQQYDAPYNTSYQDESSWQENPNYQSTSYHKTYHQNVRTGYDSGSTQVVYVYSNDDGSIY